jgi:chromosomal replication initiator protein
MGKSLPPTVLSAWFSDAKVLELTENTLTLFTPPAFKRDMMLRYIPLIKDALFELFGAQYEVEILTEADRSAQPPSASPPRGGDRSEFSFDSFVVGPTNEFAYASARAVAESPGFPERNPLVIYGGSGLGKTHLLYAILNAAKKNNPGMILRETSADAFTSELVNALRGKRVTEFKEKYHAAQLLLVDDIQFIGKTDFGQEEFFHTFNALRDANYQIVITSDKPPRDLPLLEERLKTRLEGGLTVDIQPPDDITRRAIVKDKAARLGFVLSEEVVEFLADNIRANVRQLEGSVKKIKARRDMEGLKTVTVDAAKLAIADLMRENPGMKPTPELILSEVCSYFGVSERDLLGKGRTAEVAFARQVAMYLVKRLTELTDTEVGEKVFTKDRTTVSYAVQKIDMQRVGDTHLDSSLGIIIENIRSR